MEEVDNIIIHSLRQIGCDIDDSVTNLSGFNTDLIVEATIRCLEIIQPDIEISKIVPTNMAARFRLGGNLAQACLELGYRGDIGYQTFLYSSETDLRRVFIFLIEKLPKENDKKTNESISKLDELEKSIAGILSKQLSAHWLPHYCHKKTSGCHIRVPYKSQELGVPLLDKEKEFEEYYTKHQLLTANQLTDHKVLLPSIISHNALSSHYKSMDILERLEWLNNQSKNNNDAINTPINNLQDLRLMSRFSLNERLQDQLKSDELYQNDDAKQKKMDKVSSIISSDMSPIKATKELQNFEIEHVKAECEQLRININSYQKETKELTIHLSQFAVRQQEKENELKVLKDRRKIKRRTHDLLNDSDNNIEKLEAAIETERNKIINLANQWEEYRTPLIKKYRDEREKHSHKANTSQKKLDEFRQMKEKERELSAECQIKDQQYEQLLVEVQKQAKEVNRSAYTQRILEIINNVRKQKNEIDKILGDTREIQKEINMLTGKLERSFTVVDELIFRDAKTSEASRKAYKLLATLHSDCSELVTLVEETGTTLREIRDLEEQIDSESAKNIEANLQRITADLEQMRQETASLYAQLATKGS
ncbi:hypothetical protein PV325_000123 [Microctonus aethiopoides]|uniref:Coiled-coil domain-containing protein 22 homolog n=1 Tax=Microctonus aethiopoides TaxID=144406 RepID=A0AA39C6X1_9HYME|nr:hypothetical protein PV326_005900 [Microctonus aethiopoides]KAK0090459.1 hypothetical protein PV325_000123 [Microctonus aethiopoides]KAK0159025.1 hypothetical protein PV328_009957 [Microctonus aethiopoides]